ncbi:hypothetical protein [Sorangium sp. So ce854]
MFPSSCLLRVSIAVPSPGAARRRAVAPSRSSSAAFRAALAA